MSYVKRHVATGSTSKQSVSPAKSPRKKAKRRVATTPRGTKVVSKTPRRLPKTIEVAGDTVPVLRREIPESDQAFGFYQHLADGSIIVVDSRITGYRELAVFFHEMVHAITEKTGMGLKHRQVTGLGEMLAQTLAPYLKF